MQAAPYINGGSLDKTIFVAIAAQDDEELKHTVSYIFHNANLPGNIKVGVALTAKKHKSLKELKKLAKKYDVDFNFIKQKKNNLSSLGIGKGRSRAATLYSGQDYMIQIDCHTFFDKGWDTTLIYLFEEACKEVGDKDIVLTGIPPAYKYCCSKHNEPIKTGSNTRYPFYEPQHFFVDIIPKWKETDIINVTQKQFLPCSKVSPAFIMGGKSFANNPGIHYSATFYDEDLTQSVNLFSRGFAFVFPNVLDLPVRHLDSNGIVKGHDRSFILDYVDRENKLLLHENMKKEYLKFAKDPKNKDAVQKYKDYARVDLLKGCFIYNQNLVPGSFR